MVKTRQPGAVPQPLFVVQLLIYIKLIIVTLSQVVAIKSNKTKPLWCGGVFVKLWWLVLFALALSNKQNLPGMVLLSCVMCYHKLCYYCGSSKVKTRIFPGVVVVLCCLRCYLNLWQLCGCSNVKKFKKYPVWWWCVGNQNLPSVVVVLCCLRCYPNLWQLCGCSNVKKIKTSPVWWWWCGGVVILPIIIPP